METHPSPEGVQRKLRSEVVLRAEGVPINALLPVIETEKAARKRTKEEIAYRALALLVVAAKGEGADQRLVDRLIGEYGLANHLTPKEKAFIRDASPSDHERLQFVWRYEAAWVLFWSLGYVETLEKPTEICDVGRAVGFIKGKTMRQFLTAARVRPMPDILDQADRIYRYHWAVVEARVKGEASPASLSPDVVMERHHALNWLYGYMDQEWDDISRDT